MPTTSPARPPARKPASLPACGRLHARKRGAPRGNTNALTHGAYSSRALTPLSTAMLDLASMRRRFPPFPAPPPPGFIEAAQSVFWQLAGGSPPRAPLELRLDSVTRLGQASAFLWRLRMRQYRLTRHLHDLGLIAPRALDLLRLDFHDHGVACHQHLFRVSSTKRHFNSIHASTASIKHNPLTVRPRPTSAVPPLTFLTAEQWALLEPLLTSPNESLNPTKDQVSNLPSPNGCTSHLGRGRGWGWSRSRRGRPPTDPRRPLDAIFLKLASGCRWKDLPHGSPPMLTCRRYYRRLYNSGILFVLYARLFEHLQEHGVSLPGLVRQGCFVVGPRRQLALNARLSATWQHRTALLYLQLALHTLRRRRREYERRRSLPCLLRALAALNQKDPVAFGRMAAGLNRKDPRLLRFVASAIRTRLSPLPAPLALRQPAPSVIRANSSFPPGHPGLEPVQFSSPASRSELLHPPSSDLFLNSSYKRHLNSSNLLLIHPDPLSINGCHPTIDGKISACYNSTMSAIIAIDIGGTQLRVAIYPHDNTTPMNIQRAPTRGLEDGVYDRLTALLDSTWPQEPVDAISVAAPGPLNPYTGIITETPNIPAWVNYPLAELLSSRYKVPVFLGNDANLALLGEWRYGAGQGHHNLVYLTISTGIGGAAICNDILVEGYRGMATELGHITVLPDGPVCSCGVRGHLEAVASGPAIVRYVCEKISAGRNSVLSSEAKLTARVVAEAAKGGDSLAREAFDRAGRLIGQATADYLHIFNPSIVIFGGGVTLSGDLIMDPIKETMRRSVMAPSYLDGLQIANARLGDDAGLLGSLAQAHVRLSKL